MTNQVFWQEEAGKLGVIREGQIPTQIEDDQLVVKVHAWAMNPADILVQDTSLPFITYPLVLGEDIAGTVERVGATAAAQFKVGDRVTGMGLGANSNKAEEGAFQNYVVIRQSVACKIPDSLPFSEAVVLPLCINTAAGALFSKSFFGLPFPKMGAANTGKTILIWGGSSGVGSNAIQLCKAAGIRVVTTCSARNFETVKRLGAAAAFDYNSATVVDNIVAELDQHDCVGIFNAAGDATHSCSIARKTRQKLPIKVTSGIPEGAASEGVDIEFVFSADGASLYKEISPATFAGYLPEALAKGTYVIAPSPEILPKKGIEGIQDALDKLKKGVSATKLVVEAA